MGIDQVMIRIMTGSVLFRIVGEIFPPSVLFGEEIIAVPAIHTELRDFLDFKGTSLVQHYLFILSEVKSTVSTS